MVGTEGFLINGEGALVKRLGLLVAVLVAIEPCQKLIRMPGGTHGFAGETAQHRDWPDFFAESIQWLDQHLKARPGTTAAHK